MRHAGKLLLAVVTIAPGVIPLLSQTPPAQNPSFEVASVKVSLPSNDGQNWDYKSGRFVARHVTLRTLIQLAYGVQDFLISGGPQWLDASPTSLDRFDINAKADGNPSRDQMNQMLQTLLTDRFMLEFHRENKILPGYTLVIAEHGHKLGRSTESDASSARFSGGRCHVVAENTSMAELSSYLSGVVNRQPVWDRTGLKGRFKFKFDCVPEVVRLAEQPDGTQQAEPEPPPTGPSIFEAVKALGLKLESAKGPVEVLVIDSVQKPSEN